MSLSDNITSLATRIASECKAANDRLDVLEAGPFVATIGDGSSTAITVTHNFGTRDVRVEVYENSGSYKTVIADVTRPSVDSITVTFETAPAAGQYRVVVI